LEKDGLNVYSQMAKDKYTETINSSDTRSYTQMNISHSGVSGVVVLELFKDIAPKTCENFIGLCDGITKKSDGAEIGYKDTEIHRIVPGMYI
jgi:cyclophilin family peptidyl-prolyl cis-trans isomerase